MTREEAIMWLIKPTITSTEISVSKAKELEAYDMAIEALSAEAKGDLISRKWLLGLYGDYIGDDGESKYHVPLEVVRQNIKDAPSAEARPTGEWIDTEFLKLKECSCCHNRWGVYSIEEFDFCPSCGARMKPYKGGESDD